MKGKINEKKQAILLRKKGLSVGKIAKKLKVSKGSVSVWVRDVVLTEKMKQDNLNNKSSSAKALLPFSLKRKKDALYERKENQKKGFLIYKKRDFIHAFACGVFYGEGSKNKNVVNICNCDAELLVFFVNFLRKYFKVKNEKFRVRVNCYVSKDLTIEEISKYWSNKLKIPLSQFQKPTTREGEWYKHKYGICSVNVNSTEIVQQLFGSIKGYLGEKSDRWLS